MGREIISFLRLVKNGSVSRFHLRTRFGWRRLVAAPAVQPTVASCANFGCERQHARSCGGNAVRPGVKCAAIFFQNCQPSDLIRYCTVPGLNSLTGAPHPPDFTVHHQRVMQHRRLFLRKVRRFIGKQRGISTFLALSSKSKSEFLRATGPLTDQMAPASL